MAAPMASHLAGEPAGDWLAAVVFVGIALGLVVVGFARDLLVVWARAVPLLRYVAGAAVAAVVAGGLVAAVGAVAGARGSDGYEAAIGASALFVVGSAALIRDERWLAGRPGWLWLRIGPAFMGLLAFMSVLEAAA